MKKTGRISLRKTAGKLGAFFTEAKRVLKSEGQLVITTFFAADTNADIEVIKEWFPYVAQDVDRLFSINATCDELVTLGFDVSCESIGAHVWDGFDKWLEQTDFHDQWGHWGRNWRKAFHQGWVDYYLITANKKYSSK